MFSTLQLSDLEYVKLRMITSTMGNVVQHHGQSPKEDKAHFEAQNYSKQTAKQDEKFHYTIKMRKRSTSTSSSRSKDCKQVSTAWISMELGYFLIFLPVNHFICYISEYFATKS